LHLIAQQTNLKAGVAHRTAVIATRTLNHLEQRTSARARPLPLPKLVIKRRPRACSSIATTTSRSSAVRTLRSRRRSR
jgi:hypothetical protein